MCGLAVVIGHRSPISSRVGWAMLETMRHRGPDGSGVVTFDGGRPTVSRSPDAEASRGSTLLAFARLAIIDLSPAGFQPMADEHEDVWVVFNGEIFNFRELRRELEAKGHRFASRTDTEVLVHGWDEWRDELFQRINGMFALCLHDRRTGETVFARDRLGIKPLYYATRADGALVVASEVKALLSAGVDAQLDPAGVDSYLNWRWVPDPDTAFLGVKKLEAGHLLHVGADGATRIERYWDLRWELDRDGEVEIDELRGAVGRAVARQLVSDVPLGAFFSGGIDSTAVVEIMRREMSPERPTCFTIGFSKRDLAHDVVPDDLRFSRLYSSRSEIDYREAILRPSLVDSLPGVVWHLEEPIADPAALSAYFICEAASRDHTVLLSGMGGDELFGGYPRYVAAAVARWYRWAPRPLRAAARLAADSLPAAGGGALARFGRNSQKLLSHAELPFPEDYLSFLTYFDNDLRRQLYSGDFAAAVNGSNPSAIIGAHLDVVGDSHWLHQAMYVDLKIYLPALLTYMDKMSMAHSIEARVPLLDELVVDVMRRVAPRSKVSGTHTKTMFKQAMAGIVPKEIINRGKAGFTAPVRGWLANELADFAQEVLSPAEIRRRALFEPEPVQRLIADFRSGRRDTAMQIWQLLTLELWQQAFLDRSVAKASSL
ncbi:MAG: asparagine synthase (glutamine-hydrolyzing) [Gaiellaceae bacterium]